MVSNKVNLYIGHFGGRRGEEGTEERGRPDRFVCDPTCALVSNGYGGGDGGSSSSKTTAKPVIYTLH